MQNESHYVADLPSSALNTSNVVHSVMRFLWLLRRRKTVLFLSIITCITLGGLYFATATRTYRAKAAVLVRISQPDSLSVTQSTDRSTQDQMATFERLVTSRVVLEKTLSLIGESPPELLPDMTHEEMLVELSEMIRASAIRRTSIIEVSADSRGPDAALNLANAAVSAYVEYIDENHKSVTTEVITLLNQDRQHLQERLAAKENELLEAKRGCADFGISGASSVVHPLIQNVISFNESLLKTRERRIQLESSLTALRNTIHSKGDLQQHLLFLEPLLGKELMLNAIGMNSHDVVILGRIEQELLENQATFASLQRHYGPNYPSVVETANKIRTAQDYLKAFQAKKNARMSGMQDKRLGAMLIQMVEDDLARTWAQENQLNKQLELAQAKANIVTDRLSAVQIIDRNVQTLRNLHDALVSRIETIDINQSQSDVRVSIVDPPVRPDKPISPRIQRIGLITSLMGFLVGSLIIYVTDVMDDRFRSPEELQEQLGVPVLAMVRKHQQREGVGVEAIQVHCARDAVESEAFRTLRTALSLSGQNTERIVITSAEPSDGKTTVLTNLGASFAQSGKRTLLIDCDMRRPGLTTLFDLRRREGVAEILRGDAPISELCWANMVKTELEGLAILPSGRRPADPAELLSRDRFADLIAWAETEYNQIIIDSPPILAASDAAIMGRFVDGLLVVVQPQKNHRRGVIRAFESIAAIHPTILGLVINAVSPDESSGYDNYGGFGYGYGYGYGYDHNERDDEIEQESTPESVSQISPDDSADREEGVPIRHIGAKESAADELIPVRRADNSGTMNDAAVAEGEHESVGQESDITQADTILVEPSSTTYFRDRAA